MKWSYKTVHFELKKEGLLGGSFLDEAEIEEQLNDFGRSGWELISVIEVQDGIIAFFKQPLSLGLASFAKKQAEQEIEEADDDHVEEFIPTETEPPDDRYEEYVEEIDEQADFSDGQLYEVDGVEEHQDQLYEHDTDESADQPEDYPEHEDIDEVEDKTEDDLVKSGIGAIRIE